MMQMNQVICIALMSSFFLSSASAMFKPGAQDAGWEAVYNLIDTSRKGHITVKDLQTFFQGTSDFATQFDGSAREGITNLVTSNGGRLSKREFIEYLKSRSQQTTTLKALQRTFPGQSRVLGGDLNKKWGLNAGKHLTFDPQRSYGLQEAADMIDSLMRK